MPGETNIDESENKTLANEIGGSDDEPLDEKPAEGFSGLDEPLKGDGQEDKDIEEDTTDQDKGTMEGSGRTMANEPQSPGSEYKFFVIHKSTGKVEILDQIQPGVVSYTYDPEAVTPRDIQYIAQSCREVLPDTQIEVYMRFDKEANRAFVWLDIRNRSDISIGTMELWRWK